LCVSNSQGCCNSVLCGACSVQQGYYPCALQHHAQAHSTASMQVCHARWMVIGRLLVVYALPGSYDSMQTVRHEVLKHTNKLVLGVACRQWRHCGFPPLLLRSDCLIATHLPQTASLNALIRPVWRFSRRCRGTSRIFGVAAIVAVLPGQPAGVPQHVSRCSDAAR
jgi:hypothetical protein